MFARISAFEGRSPDRIDDGIRNAREFVLPAFREIPGFQGIVVFVDRTTGKWIAASLWSSEETMRASEEPTKHLRDQTTIAGEAMVSVDRYEVAVLEVEAGTAVTTE